MTNRFPIARRALARQSSPRSGFFLEMAFLLLFAGISLAIVFSLMGAAYSQAKRNDSFNEALNVATSLAEQSAAGQNVPASTEVGQFTVVCTPRTVHAQAGQLECLDVQILDGQETVYSFQTATYEAGGSR